MDAVTAGPLAKFVDGWTQLGCHELRVDEDILWIRTYGVVTGDDQRNVQALINALYERFGYILVLNDVRGMTSVSPEARRLMHESMRAGILPGHTVIYGAKPWMRAMATLSQRAIQMLIHKTFPLSFAADEREARAILLANRPVPAAGSGGI